MGKLFLGTREVTVLNVFPEISPLNVTPTTSAQVIEASSGGYNPINVSAVTSAIDNNIQAGNIKKNVNILGVTGNLEAKEGILREVSAQGVLQKPTQSFTFSLPSSATDIGDYALYLKFASMGAVLTSVDFSSLTTINGDYAIAYAFQSCSGLTSISFPNLVTINSTSALHYAFYNCTNITSVNFPSLTTINSSQYALRETFYNCTKLVSVDFSNLTTIGGRGRQATMYETFKGCTSLTTVSFPKLSDISDNIIAMYRAFKGCTSLASLSFPALNSNSFGSTTNQFQDMLSGVTGCTVHFPSNLESVIGSWTDVTAGFGGTNTTILYDLPVTS